MPSLILFASLLTLAIGTVILWTNPRRLVNKTFFLASLNAALWLLFVFLAARAGESHAAADPIPWLRAASATGAFFPWILWLLMAAILIVDGSPSTALRRSWPWFVLAVSLAALCYTDYFIPSDSTPDNPKRGVGYLVYSSASFTIYAFLVLVSYRHIRKAQGVRRIELQFLSFNSGLTCLTAIVLMGLGSYLDLRLVSRLGPLAALVFYGLTAWAITVHRVFDAKQVFLSMLQRFILVLVLGAGILGVEYLLQGVMPSYAGLILSVAAGSSFAFLLERKTREWFRLTAEQHIAELRRTLIEAARNEPSPDKLVVDFEGQLQAWSQAGFARLLFDSGEMYVSSDIEFAKGRPAHAALCRSGWSTPESLQRQRAEPDLVDLRQFLTESDLGLAVTAPRGSPAPSLLVVLGTKANQRPFTYPEVQRVQEIAEFMDNILARSRLTRQARQSEQLATIGLLGASLAHEIRNPLVSIKTFAHLLPTRFEDPEFRRRFRILIPAEVDRIDSLTQQLLDLSNPRRHQMDRLSLHAVVRETLDLMLTRAAEARVTLVSALNATTDTIWADASAIRQVLINLLINAIQAFEPRETVEPHESSRRVELHTRNSSGGGVILEVSDNGPGIPEDQRHRLFHPFASTKTKGMGLGLAVCADILHEHKAAIIVPDIGRPGATFRITFPCPPPLS